MSGQYHIITSQSVKDLSSQKEIKDLLRKHENGEVRLSGHAKQLLMVRMKNQNLERR